MKKKYLILPFLAVLCSIVFSSYKDGPASHNWDCTGAETGLGNPTGCKGSGCHGNSATAAITISIELDSSGIATTHYTPGHLYSVKITGTNTGTNSLPKWGVQIACIKGTSAVATPVIAGAWGAAPANFHLSPPSAGNYVASIMEHNSVRPASSGAGGTGTTYTVSFPWTSPTVAGTGDVSFWVALNACDGNNSDSNDFWNTNHLNISEWPSSGTGIAESTADALVHFYPNPVSNDLHLKVSNRNNASLRIFDVNGNCMLNTSLSNPEMVINLSNWSNGLYVMEIKQGENSFVQKIVKQ